MAIGSERFRCTEGRRASPRSVLPAGTTTSMKMAGPAGPYLPRVGVASRRLAGSASGGVAPTATMARGRIGARRGRPTGSPSRIRPSEPGRSACGCWPYDPATELRQKGVGDEAVGAALAELDPDTEVATARALVERKLRSTPGGTPDALLRRLVGMLARKGYPAGLAIRVVREVLAERAADTDATSAELDEWATDLDPGTRGAEANGVDGEDLP